MVINRDFAITLIILFVCFCFYFFFFFLFFFFFCCFFVVVFWGFFWVFFFSKCFSFRVPSGHLTFIQRRLNVDRCIDVEATLYRRHVSAGFILKKSRYI